MTHPDTLFRDLVNPLNSFARLMVRYASPISTTVLRLRYVDVSTGLLPVERCQIVATLVLFCQVETRPCRWRSSDSGSADSRSILTCNNMGVVELGTRFLLLSRFNPDRVPQRQVQRYESKLEAPLRTNGVGSERHPRVWGHKLSRAFQKNTFRSYAS